MWCPHLLSLLLTTESTLFRLIFKYLVNFVFLHFRYCNKKIRISVWTEPWKRFFLPLIVDDGLLRRRRAYRFGSTNEGPCANSKLHREDFVLRKFLIALQHRSKSYKLFDFFATTELSEVLASATKSHNVLVFFDEIIDAILTNRLAINISITSQ